MPANGDRAPSGTSRGSIAVFAPSPVLTITAEAGADQPEIHLHAGGQGFWVARMAALLGAEVMLCCALGGEAGRVLRPVIEAEAAVSPGGEPAITGRGGVAGRAAQLGVTSIHLSLSHDAGLAMAFVVCEGPGPDSPRRGG